MRYGEHSPLLDEVVGQWNLYGHFSGSIFLNLKLGKENYLTNFGSNYFKREPAFYETKARQFTLITLNKNK